VRECYYLSVSAPRWPRAHRLLVIPGKRPSTTGPHRPEGEEFISACIMKSRERVLISRNAILNASITQHRQPADNQTPNSTATSRWLFHRAANESPMAVRRVRRLREIDGRIDCIFPRKFSGRSIDEAIRALAEFYRRSRQPTVTRQVRPGATRCTFDPSSRA